MLTPERYEFGGFALDVFERRLTQGSRAVALAPKAFDVLVGLVRHGGRLITKRELLDQVWPESCVEEGILSVHISALRKALGHECIETVAKSGYRVHGLTDKPAIPLRAHTEVYELFGRGRAHLLSASLGEIPQALEAFRAAIELDPLYAEAHAGLALAHCAQAELRLTPHADAYRDARASALRSLALDPASADAQAALGKVLFLSEWNWTAAERSFDRALALNSQHTEAHLLSGQLLEALGRLDEGLERKRQALQRDPFSASVYLQISLSYWNQRRYDDSIEWANKALELNPRHSTGEGTFVRRVLETRRLRPAHGRKHQARGNVRRPEFGAGTVTAGLHRRRPPRGRETHVGTHDRTAECSGFSTGNPVRRGGRSGYRIPASGSRHRRA